MAIIFLDMDGVLVDLDRHIESKYGTLMKDMNRDQRERLWAEDFSVDWFYDAPPMPDMQKLLDHVTSKHTNIRLLTALPNRRKDMAWQSMEAKIAWTHKHIGNHIPVTFGPFAIDKQKHCVGRHCILIDDNTKNVDQWFGVGGFAVLHQNADDTIKILEGIGL